MKLFMDKCRTTNGLEMTEEDFTFGDTKSNLNAPNLNAEGNVSFENITATSGGAISLLQSVAAPPNDLILVTNRCGIILCNTIITIVLKYTIVLIVQANLNIAKHTWSYF